MEFAALKGLHTLPALALMLLAQGAAAADDDVIDTDRPDFVESSKVVGKGRFQFETSIAGEHDRVGAVRARSEMTPTLLRWGVSDTLELRFESDGLMRTRTTEGAFVQDEHGFADASLGLKWHLRDASADQPSVGLLLHADIDSGSAPFRGRGVRPSLRLVAEWELPDDMSLGLMPGASIEKNEAGERYLNGILGIVLGKAWTPRLRGFVELAVPKLARNRDGGTEVRFDVGAAYLINDRCQVDTALSRGLSKRAVDFSWTVGLSYKL